MNRDNKNTSYTARDIEQYLAGNLSPMQMHALEKAALDDPFLAEAMEGYAGMKETEWNNELVAIREALNNKGTVAKVIPLHRSKNNWWKAAAAIFLLGTAAVVTYILNRDNTENVQGPQIAQTITTVSDSLPASPIQAPASVTVSLNPTASSTKEEIKANTTAATQTLAAKQQVADRYIADPNAPQLKPAAKNEAAGITDNARITPAVPPAVNNAVNTNEQLSEDAATAKSIQAAKANNEMETWSREKRQADVIAKKETAFNNFFTAQVVGADNAPLPFTNISIKKDNFGTYADAKGMVRLVSTDSILNIEVRSVGYLPKTYALRTNQAQTKIVLQEEEMALKDKTVIGNVSTTAGKRSRRATLVSDSAVNVEPADGWDNYNTYVANNLDIPDEMLKSDFHGEVELSFDVKSNGTVSNIRINKSAGAGYDEAARRLILEGPQWKVKKGKRTSANIKLQF